MTAWRQVRCGDIFKIKHGFAFKGAHFSDDPGAIVLTPGNFEAGGGLKLRPGKDRSYSADFPPEFRLQANDMLVVMTDLTQEAAILGAPAIVPEHLQCLHNQRLGKIVNVDEDQANWRFLYYVFNTHEYREHLRATATGSTVKHTSPSRIYEHKIYLPPLATQRRIASILGAYDELIEVNRRRIAVLEEMARGLFEEWFVRFRFPGHEAVPILDTPDGSLPEGWAWGAAADLMAFDPKTHIPRDGLKPFISMGHLDTANSLIASPEARDGNSGAKFRNGDTLFARITPCLENGKTGLVRNLPGQDGIGFGSTEFIVMRGKAAGPAFTYCLARQSSFRDNAQKSMSGATGRQRARTVSLASFAMPAPPLELLRHFDTTVWPMLELVGSLGTANANLAASRDLILPRLISGQLTVAEAESELEEAA